jgi:5-dehydro-4-deoxyglucarate dehydratase
MDIELEELRVKLRGVIAFPVTPFNPNLTLDVAGLRHKYPTASSASDRPDRSCRGTGEMYSLTPCEHMTVVRTIVEEVRGQIPVIRGTGFNSSIAIELARQSAVVGVDGILALPPYYPNADEEGLADYYAAIAAATPLAIFIYSRDWVNPLPAWVEHVAARIPTLIGWKDGQGDLGRYQEIMNREGDRLYWIGGPGDAWVPAYYGIGIRT